MTSNASIAAGGTATGSAAGSDARRAPPTRRVVDAPIRMFHALFALSFLGAWLTSEAESLRLLHVTLGYTIAGLLAFRLVYGLIGPRQARLRLLWQRIVGLRAWLGALRRTRNLRRAPWRQALPLVLGASIVLLLIGMLPLLVTGYASYQEWGDVFGGDLFEELHEVLGSLAFNVMLVHLLAVVAVSLSLRRNLARQMFDGRIPGRGPDPARSNRAWLAATMLTVVLGYWTWAWVDSPNGLLPWDLARAVGVHERDGDD
ncbi:MAG: cytochrome b/b6 domain-containing protein [Burkholderiaceae bacterium]